MPATILSTALSKYLLSLKDKYLQKDVLVDLFQSFVVIGVVTFVFVYTNKLLVYFFGTDDHKEKVKQKHKQQSNEEAESEEQKKDD
jgi:ATP/ADP translocase